MLNVKFLKGTVEQYNTATKDANTFYYVGGTDLYLGEIKLSNAADLTAAIANITSNDEAIKAVQAELKKLVGEESEKSIQTMIDDSVKAVDDKIGNTELETTNKTLSGAINELKAAIGTGGTAAVVTMTESTPEGYAKAYTIKQGETAVGTINIPKDMVVSSGKLVTNPEGQTAGTYIELTLANNDGSKIYIDVKDLIDIYSAVDNASEVQVAVTADGKISASLVDSGISTAKLADNAVTTLKIADENVTKAKLSTEVKNLLDNAATQANLDTVSGKVSALETAIGEGGSVSTQITTEIEKLDKADTAVAGKYVSAVSETDGIITVSREDLPTYTLATGATNGTVKLNDSEVAVAGLKSAAYADTTAFDAAGSASAAQEAAEATATTKANAAETNAKAYTDSALTWGTISE